jgi:hypothetical protein
MGRTPFPLALAIALAACQVAASGHVGGAMTGTARPPNVSQGSGGHRDDSPREHRDDSSPVPDLLGKTPDDANAVAQAAGFTAVAQLDRDGMDCDHRAGPGHVVCQTPRPGALVKHHLVRIHVFTPQSFPGQLIRGQLLTLCGLTVEQARQRLRELGHTGRVFVDEYTQYNKKCGLNLVCAVEPEAGIGLEHDIHLRINPKLTVAAPPP